MITGCAAFIYATNFSDDGLIANGYIGPLPCMIIVTGKIIYALRNKIKLGTFIDYNDEWEGLFGADQTLTKKNLIPLFGNWLTNSGSIFCNTIAFRYAKLGGLNQGVI